MTRPKTQVALALILPAEEETNRSSLCLPVIGVF